MAHADEVGRRPDADGGLRLERVTFAYGRQVVVRAVSLRIAPGERVGLLGPNGAGKSTLLRLASGVLRPAQGRIWLGDAPLTRLARMQVARRVAVVPQDFAVQFAYTVRQLVTLGRTPHAGTWGLLGKQDESAIDAALAATDLAPLADRIFNDLSGGERQRVLVAMALAQSSPLVLLDEPTAHLDIRHQVEVLELLSRLNQEHGLTVVAALHDLNLAARYFPRLVLFRHEIVAEGTPAAVLDPGLLARVYDTPVQVGILRGDAALSIVPPGAASGVGQVPAPGSQTARIHVVAGGGSGELLLRSLADASIAFTAGALQVGESDYVLARRLAVTCVGELPYAPLSPRALEETQRCMAAAAAIAVCPAPIGPGNLALLDTVLQAARAGARVYLLEPRYASLGQEAADAALGALWRERDFADGRAATAYAELLAAGAVVVATPGELVARLLAAGSGTQQADRSPRPLAPDTPP